MTTYLSPGQVAAALGVSRRTVVRLAARDGRIGGYRAVRIGAQWRFVESPLPELIPPPVGRQRWPATPVQTSAPIGGLPADYEPCFPHLFPNHVATKRNPARKKKPA